MSDFSETFVIAFDKIINLDSDLVEIVLLSMQVSLTALLIASLLALPVGAILAIKRFPTRQLWIGVLTAFMGLPPVVVGLVIYLILSRSGLLGPLGILFTPQAMIIAQVVLIFPIVATFSYQIISDLHCEYDEQLRSLGCSVIAVMKTLLYEGRFSLLTAVLAGFGRATAEVGAVLIVGGNINHATRVMTTTIALEASKGNLALALGLGLILIMLSLGIVFLVQLLRRRNESGVKYV